LLYNERFFRVKERFFVPVVHAEFGTFCDLAVWGGSAFSLADLFMLHWF
jgi:hypothetical protein